VTRRSHGPRRRRALARSRRGHRLQHDDPAVPAPRLRLPRRGVSLCL